MADSREIEVAVPGSARGARTATKVGCLLAIVSIAAFGWFFLGRYAQANPQFLTGFGSPNANLSIQNESASSVYIRSLSQDGGLAFYLIEPGDGRLFGDLTARRCLSRPDDPFAIVESSNDTSTGDEVSDAVLHEVEPDFCVNANWATLTWDGKVLTVEPVVPGWWVVATMFAAICIPALGFAIDERAASKKGKETPSGG